VTRKLIVFVRFSCAASCNEDYTLSLTLSNGINCSATCEIVKVVSTEKIQYLPLSSVSDLGLNQQDYLRQEKQQRLTIVVRNFIRFGEITSFG
jgi:hypothetical protein